MRAPLDIDFLVRLTRLGPITIHPLDALVTKPLPEVLGPFARGDTHDADLEGGRWRVYPLRVPSGLGFIFDLRMVGKLEVGADDGRVRFTMPRALASSPPRTGPGPSRGRGCSPMAGPTCGSPPPAGSWRWLATSASGWGCGRHGRLGCVRGVVSREGGVSSTDGTGDRRLISWNAARSALAGRVPRQISERVFLIVTRAETPA